MEVIFGILIALGIGAFIAFMHPELAWFLLPIEKLVRWGKRVFFGIDKPLIGPEALVGRRVETENHSVPNDKGSGYAGKVKVDGELWSVQSARPFRAGQSVKIEAANGAILKVSVT